MYRLLTAASVLAFLSACGDGQPFFDEDVTEEETDAGDGATDGDGIEGDGDVDASDGVDGAALPPGTTEPNDDDGIVRYEARNAQGGGRVVSPVSYDADSDTFSVDNLAFDGLNTYQRGTDISQMGGYAVYEADVAVADFLDGDSVDQIVPYRAILGMSRNSVTGGSGDAKPRTSFAIVRTGGYTDYGFGGFVYEREGGVVLPDGGQASFSGDYAGIRVFQGRGGLEYTRGDMVIDVDFDDFDTTEGVQGVIYNREAFEADGTPIDSGTGAGELPLPAVTFVVNDGAGGGIDDNGELTGGVSSSTTIDGALTTYETGTYYAVVAGDLTDPDDGGEITGIVVMDSTDPRDGAAVQETGGFILYR